MVDKGGRKEFGNGMIVYIDTRTVDVGMIVGVEVGFGGKDTRDGNEGDDEDGVGDTGSSPPEVMLTSCYGAEGRTEECIRLPSV